MTPRERLISFLKKDESQMDEAEKAGVNAFVKIINAAVADERERCATIALELDIEEFSGRSRENHVRETIYQAIMNQK